MTVYQLYNELSDNIILTVSMINMSDVEFYLSKVGLCVILTCCCVWFVFEL